MSRSCTSCRGNAAFDMVVGCLTDKSRISMENLMVYLRYNIWNAPMYQWLRFIRFSGISQWKYTKIDSESKNKILLYKERTWAIGTIITRNLLTTFSRNAPWLLREHWSSYAALPSVQNGSRDSLAHNLGDSTSPVGRSKRHWNVHGTSRKREKLSRTEAYRNTGRHCHFLPGT